MLVIPAIDLRGGQCVRLIQGDYAQEKTYDSDPVRVACEFAEEGAEWIHVVDLDGAKSGMPLYWDALEAIAKSAGVPIEVGGGIRSAETARRLLDLGIARVVVGTKLVEDPELAAAMFSEFGDRIVAGIDERQGKVAIAGWIEQTAITAVDLALKMEELGAMRLILTDISRDGMLSGPNLDLLNAVSASVTIPIIHSGGIGDLDDLKLLYDKADRRPEGVIVGRAIYEGRFTVKQAVDLVESFGWVKSYELALKSAFNERVLMDPGQIAVFIPILGIIAGIVAIMTKHQQRMAEIIHASPQHQPNGEVAQLRIEVAELKQLVHQQMIALDSYAGMSRPPVENPLQKRLEQI